MSSYIPALRQYGIGIVYNLSLKDVSKYEEVEMELGLGSLTERSNDAYLKDLLGLLQEKVLAKDSK